jgi:ABC-type phosphate/phosphonate transport system permease subunit
MIPAIVLGIIGAGIFGTLFALYPQPASTDENVIY